MSQRVTASQRISMQNSARRAVMRYAHDHALWHKHIHNVTLDSVQLLKCIEMDEHKMTIDFACRRGGKTAIKELYLMRDSAINEDQELGIVAPKVDQSIVNLSYHLDAIRRSEILSAYLMVKRGRKQIADTYYQFANRSRARAYGIMSQVDGGDLTSASLEEVDDMPKDRLYSRFLLMLGSTRRLGASDKARNDPQIRITGVFKGADTLIDLLEAGSYFAVGCFQGEIVKQKLREFIGLGHIESDAVDPESYKYPLPIVNAITGVDIGILHGEFIKQMLLELPPDDAIRQLFCINVSARNLIFEKFVRRALQVGLMAEMSPAEPLPGKQYKKRGLIGFGYDASGHGENPQSSKHAFVVTEQIGNYVFFPFVYQWPAGEDDQVVKRDLFGFWQYFRPDVAYGDAYGVGMLTQLNDELFAEGLTEIDRRAIGDGQSTASTWNDWPFSPIRFEGMTKHQMAQAIRAIFHNKQAAIPYFDDMGSDPDFEHFRAFVKQLPNIVPIPTKVAYASYKMSNSKLGDDLFDAAMAAVWALVTRGAYQAPGVVMIGTTTRENLISGGAA